MDIRKQVCNLDLAKQLKELKYKQESLWYWKHQEGEKWELAYGRSYLEVPSIEMYSAFTVAELGERLPFSITRKYKDGKVERLFLHQYPPFEGEDCFQIGYLRGGSILDHNEKDSTEANTRAKMLIYLLENKLIREG